MVWLGLSPEIAARRQSILSPMQNVSIEEQNQILAGFWDLADKGEVTETFREDLGEITAAVKRTQMLQEAVGFEIQG